LSLKSCIWLIFWFWTWILNFLDFLDYGWTWAEFRYLGLDLDYKINMAVHSSLLCTVRGVRSQVFLVRLQSWSKK